MVHSESQHARLLSNRPANRYRANFPLPGRVFSTYVFLPIYSRYQLFPWGITPETHGLGFPPQPYLLYSVPFILPALRGLLSSIVCLLSKLTPTSN
jgi:hypothetical protein